MITALQQKVQDNLLYVMQNDTHKDASCISDSHWNEKMKSTTGKSFQNAFRRNRKTAKAS
jgi:hypothetical protein